MRWDERVSGLIGCVLGICCRNVGFLEAMIFYQYTIMRCVGRAC